MTTATKPERRTLKFATLDDVILNAENLRANGYDKLGHWDLSQICLHLADWMTYPVAGFPRAPLPIRMMLWMIRATIGKAMYRKYVAEGMPSGKPTMPQSIHEAGTDSTAAIAKLNEAVERFKAFDGTLHPSPLFGALNKDEALRLQLAHCAHHLSFLIPKA